MFSNPHFRTQNISVVPLSSFDQQHYDVNGSTTVVPFDKYNLLYEMILSSTLTPSKKNKKRSEIRHTYHFLQEQVPNMLEEEWVLEDNRTVHDTYCDVDDENSLYVNDLWVKKRVFESDDGKLSSPVWIISRIYCNQENKELAIHEEPRDTEQGRDEYLRTFGVSVQLDLKEIVTFTIYQDVYKNKSDNGIECLIADAVMPDGTVKSYGRLKSAKIDDIEEWKVKLQLSPGVHPIIEYISRERSDVFQCLQVPHLDSMDGRQESSEEPSQPRFFLDGAFDDGITDEECVKFFLAKRKPKEYS